MWTSQARGRGPCICSQKGSMHPHHRSGSSPVTILAASSWQEQQPLSPPEAPEAPEACGSFSAASRSIASLLVTPITVPFIGTVPPVPVPVPLGSWLSEWPWRRSCNAAASSPSLSSSAWRQLVSGQVENRNKPGRVKVASGPA